MKSVMKITLCVGLLILIAYVTLSWAQQKPPQPKSVSVSENSWVPGLLPHGEVKDGLAAFLLCHHDCFKVGQAIPLSYGIVNVGSGLQRETNLQEADENAKFKIRIWWLYSEPELRWTYSWFEVTGPDGQDVPYRGMTGTLPGSMPLDEFSVLLHHRQFIGSVFPDLRGWLTSDLEDAEDIFFDFDLSKPGTYKVRWGYAPVWEGGPWTGTLMSNEVKFEVVEYIM